MRQLPDLIAQIGQKPGPHCWISGTIAYN